MIGRGIKRLFYSNCIIAFVLPRYNYFFFQKKAGTGTVGRKTRRFCLWEFACACPSSEEWHIDMKTAVKTWTLPSHGHFPCPFLPGIGPGL